MKTESQNSSPMTRQYFNLKESIDSDTVLLFRLGDFYELFFDDAARVAPILDISLTKRAGTPMCGIPHHALDAYLPRLLTAGLKVAIAEQTVDPKSVKGLVPRAIARVITPGTASDSLLLDSDAHNFLIALSCAKTSFGLACVDLSTGDFQHTQLDSLEDVESEIARISPREAIISDALYQHFLKNPSEKPRAFSSLTLTPLADFIFSQDYSHMVLKRHFQVQSLDAFGAIESPLGIQAAGACLYYIGDTLRQKTVHIHALHYYTASEYMCIDPITMRHLELVEPLPGHAKNNTLLYHMDQTVTPMGARLMREYMIRPLLNVDYIRQRHTAVDAFVSDTILLLEFREILSTVRDLERITARINLGTVTPRDMLSLKLSLEVLPDLITMLSNIHNASLIVVMKDKIDSLTELYDAISCAIVDDPPGLLSDGGYIKSNFDEQLDLFRKASTEGRKWLADIQQREQQRTGIKTLKIQYNRVFGYFIEVSKAASKSVPEDYIRKQTTANAERFITPELKELESTILGADEKAKALEQQLYATLRNFAQTFTSRLQRTAKAIASLDVIASFAYSAQRHANVRPHINDDMILDIHGGRHPVLDIAMTEERFVPNDAYLNDTDSRIQIITGPNMAGKSTYIRQTALLVIMAQMGAFIPVDFAQIGIVDRVFSRIGASDDISRGYSTFMVEMIETANILHHATAKSLVILDEIGRGTSTFDGLAIAWAVAEYLHDHPTAHPRTQFATHYHELTELSLLCEGCKNYYVAVKEHGDQIIFLRQILPGIADKSYGIQVARLAGLPTRVVNRAFQILDNLEKHSLSASGYPTFIDEKDISVCRLSENLTKKEGELRRKMPVLPKRNNDFTIPDTTDGQLYLGL